MGKESYPKTFTGPVNNKAELDDDVRLLSFAMRKSRRKMEKTGKNSFSHRRHHDLLLLPLLLLISQIGIFPGAVEGNGDIESCVVQPRLSTNSDTTNVAGVQNDETGASGSSDDGLNISNDNNEPPYSIICHIRTLSPNLDIKNLTSSATSVEKIKLVCNDVLFFQSELKSGQLSYMPELHDLTIENCKLTKLPNLGLPNLRKLTINTGNSDWAAKSLEIEPDALPTHIRYLNIGYNNLWSVPVLCKLGSLQTLIMKSNLLSDIEDLGLPGRPALGNINRNAGMYDQTSSSSLIDATNDGEIECLSDLKILDLSYNTIRSLGSGRLQNLKNLRELRIQFNWLEEMEDDSLHGLGQLKLLNISSNRLVALPTKIFQPCKLLRQLDISNNSISALPGLLNGLVHLEVLDASYNSLSSQLISTDIFKGLIRLVVLKLSHNMLSHLGPIFDDLYTLQVLDVSNNLISSIHPSTFAPMSNLMSLNLGNNRLVTINHNMFTGLWVMHKLNLDMNNINSIDDGALKNCTSLQDLSLVGNNLHTIPHALRGLTKLKTLDIAENHISLLENDTFLGLNQLIGLRLVQNNITQLPAGLCDSISRLRVLNVAENKISKISSQAFSSCPELRVLRLDSNRLQAIPPTLAPQLPSLLWLNMSGNSIQRVDFQLFPSTLEWVDVSHNKLEYLGGAWSNFKTPGGGGGISPGSGNIGNKNNILTSNNGQGNSNGVILPRTGPSSHQHNSGSHNGHHHHSHQGVADHPNAKLRVIDASHNRLTHLDHHSIPPLLETLRLNHNQLKTVAPDTFTRAHRLMKVELVGNEIESLSLASIRFPPAPPGTSLPAMYIGGNPFECDCTMEWLTRIGQLEVLRQYPRIIDLDSIVCRLPFSRTVTHIPLVEATPKDFLCKFESHCFTLCHCCDFDHCDCLMRCPDTCSCYHDSSWSTSVVNCASTGQSEVPSLPMDAHEVYLDGNHFNPPTLKSHTFIGRKNLKTLYLNGSQIEKISNKSFNGLLTLQVLRLNNNLLRHLNGYEFESLSNLKELYLEKNVIETIANTTFLALRNLLILKLEGNRLRQFAVWQLSLNPYLVEIGLANPYTCDCQFLHHLYGWVSDNSRKVVDLAQLQCVWNTTHKPGPHLIDYNRTCGSSWALMGIENGLDFYTMSPLPLALVFVSLVTLLILVVALVILCREHLSLWLFTKFAFRFCDAAEFEDDKSYDSYLIYSQKDEEFVAQRIADELETNDNYRLCLHYRDLICETGDFKEMMIGAVENSKSVLIILSRNFLQGEWSSGEYRSAFHAVLKKSQRASKIPQKKILIVFIEDIPKVEISPDIRSWVRHNRIKVIKWNIHSTDRAKNRKFWNKLKFILPDPSSHYHSNITSNTTTTSASSNETHGGIMATLKYSTTTAQGDSNNIHHSISHPHHNNIHQHYPHHQQIIVDEAGRFTTTTTGAPPQIISSSQTNTLNSIKYWPYGATNFVALPPKYQQTTSHHSSSGGSHPPSVNSPGSTQSSHYHPPLPLSNPPKSPPSSQSTDSTTTMADDAPSLMSQLTMASFHSAANGHSGVNNMSLTKSPVPVPKSSYSRNIISTTNSENNSNSSNSSTKSNNCGESYGVGDESIEGEHVYSTLDPPSPQPVQQTMSLMSQNILGSGSSANGVGANFLNNIHLPNGYTYHVQQQWLGNNHPHHLTSSHQQSSNIGKHNHHHHQHQGVSKSLKKKDTNNPVQTYLV